MRDQYQAEAFNACKFDVTSGNINLVIHLQTNLRCP